MIPSPLREHAPRRVLDGFGRSVFSGGRYVAPRTVDELRSALEQAGQEGFSVTFRGTGNSYGDASLNSDGVAIDTSRLKRILSWDPATGVFEAEPGVTIEGLWRHTLADGYWPYVVPGTMRPTLGGCVAMNIHGKNNFRVGPFGDHVLEIELLTAQGETLVCNREQNYELFFAAIGGMGLLGATTRVKLKLKPIKSGKLKVQPIIAKNLAEMFDRFTEYLPTSDYLVGWVDCVAGGRSLGRGEIHAAYYVDEIDRESLRPEKQDLPDRLFGFPMNQLWQVMRFFTNRPGLSLTNTAKYYSARLSANRPYLQSHVAFAFLLDYVANWRLAYGRGGLIQYQIFVPDGTARACCEEILAMCQRAKMVPYLGVFKRHRPDQFLLSHAVDGWSLAMDFRVTDGERSALWALTERLTERVLEAGGRFYFAKDSVLRPHDVERAYGHERLDRFITLKKQYDPKGLITSDLYRRAILPGSPL